MDIAHDVPLAGLTTLGLGGPAKRIVRVVNVGELTAVLDAASANGERVLVLGGGSNLVVGDAGWDGVVIQLAMPAVHIFRTGELGIVNASAGATWDDFVAAMVGAGLAGVECLSGIPGLVGATPMQNVGAYGQEVADTIAFVRAYDREQRAVVKLERGDCGFGYRSSRFKGRDRWIIIDVRFRLAIREHSAPIHYAELCHALGIAAGGTAPLAQVRAAVIALRRG
jgi:UDP-N-acetylmuramate dehydrogenase